MGKRLLVELYFSHITIFVPLEFPCGLDNKKYTQCSATTAESSMGILSNAVQTEGNVYPNSAGKHLITSFEEQRHGGAWNKQSSQPLFFFASELEVLLFHQVLGLSSPHALKVLHLK